MSTSSVQHPAFPVSSQTVRLFDSTHPFTFESGVVLPAVDVRYETYGTLNASGTNAILVCHALTGSAHAAGVSAEGDLGWWDGIIGPGKGFDPSRWFILCANFLGSCYGTTGPISPDPATGEPYRLRFPQMTVRDMVRVQKALVDHLGIECLACVAGGSLGGMQALEWAVMYPGLVRSVVPIATAARHSAWCIGLNEVQRRALTSDPAWRDGLYTEQPASGLSQARMLAMISYRSYESFQNRFGRNMQEGVAPGLFQVESYLEYQGKKLVNRFDAATYYRITKAMDLHDIGRGRGSVAEAAATIKAKALCIGIDTDVLYPPQEQREIAGLLPHAEYVELHTPHGHDAFLIEFEQMNALLRRFLSSID